MFFRILSSGLMAAVVLPIAAMGQQRDDPKDEPRRTTRAEIGEKQISPNAKYLATKMALTNQVEIKLGELVASRTDSPTVRKLAEQIVLDHRQLNEKLEQMCPELAEIANFSATLQPGDRSKQPGEEGAQEQRPQKGTQTVLRQSPADATHQLVQVCEEAAQNQLDMSTQMLVQYEGQDFIMAFLGQQIVMHTHLIAELQAVQQVGPPALHQVAAKAEQVSRRHLKRAQELSKLFEDEERIGQRKSAESQ